MSKTLIELTKSLIPTTMGIGTVFLTDFVVGYTPLANNLACRFAIDVFAGLTIGYGAIKAQQYLQESKEFDIKMREMYKRKSQFRDYLKDHTTTIVTNPLDRERRN